jgi:hypothetical protein
MKLKKARINKMENKTKRTPGPWTAEQDGNIYDIKSGGFTPCTTNVIDAETDAANAALIAAAPELLSLCEEVLEAVDLDGQNRKELRKALQAAIAKAEGKF